MRIKDSHTVAEGRRPIAGMKPLASLLGGFCYG